MGGNGAKETHQYPKPNEKLSTKFILDALHESSEKSETRSSPSEKKSVPPAPTTKPKSMEKLLNERKYFRIGEAAEVMGVEPHVLRYWEQEFPGIRPMKSKSGHRTYSRKDMEIFSQIHHLLYIEKFSVKGAKKKLWERRRSSKTVSPTPIKNTEYQKQVKVIIQDLKSLLQLAKGNPGSH